MVSTKVHGVFVISSNGFYRCKEGEGHRYEELYPGTSRRQYIKNLGPIGISNEIVSLT